MLPYVFLIGFILNRFLVVASPITFLQKKGASDVAGIIKSILELIGVATNSEANAWVGNIRFH